MKRYQAFDPPEYASWTPTESASRWFHERIENEPVRLREVDSMSLEKHLDLYRGLLRFRLHDIALQRWVKQGVITKAWLGTGEEAVTVGAVHALDRAGDRGDVVAPMIRNAGACHEMGMPVADMLKGYLGSADAPTGGRDLHVGDLRYGVVAPISMVGAVATVINGYALAFARRSEPRVALTWIGDGATKHGEVHEALNFASVMKLPVIFVIQNNQVALGTRLEQHHRATDFSGWGEAYGARLLSVAGNNVLDMYAATRLAAAQCRSGEGPVFIAANTFRMGGHATHDVREARRTFAPELFRDWGRRDPIGLYEEYLVGLDRELGEGSADTREERNRTVLARIEEAVIAEVDAAAEEALASRAGRMPEPSSALTGSYASDDLLPPWYRAATGAAGSDRSGAE
jgi:TPP-dependent pyruvate/acetoin dehydrogenase alpha subunit